MKAPYPWGSLGKLLLYSTLAVLLCVPLIAEGLFLFVAAHQWNSLNGLNVAAVILGLLGIGVLLAALAIPVTVAKCQRARHLEEIQEARGRWMQVARTPERELLRAADGDPAASDHLVRPASADAEPAPDELLRPGPGG